jgi:hypothetical protein
LGSLLVALSDFLDPDRGPQQTGDFEVRPAFFFLLLGLGFVIGAIGHLTKARTLVAAGVLLVLLATVLLPIAFHATN